MLKEFYDFIAKRIISYFQTASDQHLLHPGDSFSLNLDNDEMVENVNYALENLAKQRQCIGQYEYTNVKYRTFTLLTKNNEVIIAAQINGMTNDFLCATLRNASNDANKPLLMISSTLIDSAKSGTRDMCACGMPFHAENLVKTIKKQVQNSTQLTWVEQSILQFELKRREEDVFSDTSSLYEYKELLSIMSSGKIDRESFSGFRLFFVDGKNTDQNSGEKQIEKELKENHEIFERIDRSIRFGTTEKDLADDFTDLFVKQVIKSADDESKHWSENFTYKEILAAKEKKQEKKENPLNIEEKDISAYDKISSNILPHNEKLLIRNEGSMAGKKRKLNLILFNPSQSDQILIRINCNVGIRQLSIKANNSYTSDKSALLFEFKPSALLFDKFEIKDDTNNITYVIKICIINLQPDYLVSTIRTCFVVDYKNTSKNSRIKLLGVDNNLTFNKNADTIQSVKLEEDKQYRCYYNEQLHLFSKEEEFFDYSNDIKIDINFAGIMVPFTLCPDEAKSIELIGRTILRNKFASKKSFEITNSGQIMKDSQEYFVKAKLFKELKMEVEIRDKVIMHGYYKGDRLGIEEVTIDLDEPLYTSYIELLKQYKEQRTIPTLAFIDDHLKPYIKAYIEAFFMCFKDLKNKKTLSTKQENALLLGTIVAEEAEKEIFLTPFHPINLAYQITLLTEDDMENASDLVIDRLNSINLIPYLQKNRIAYKVSNQMYSKEWKYYAPVENRTYMGSRKYVVDLVNDKIFDFVGHFKYIFDEIHNKTVRVNLINMGDCGEVFQGISRYILRAINKNPDVEKLMRFEIHIYTEDSRNNAFTNLKNYSSLKAYLSEIGLSISSGTTMTDLEGILSKNIDCYFHKDSGEEYEYAHISFYEMESDVTSESATMNDIETGLSLGGLISGTPSSKYGQNYRTGFGTKYAPQNRLVELAELYNALIQVGDTGNPFQSGVGMSTQISMKAEQKMKHVYASSNWVVFVEPKVDLEFFYEKEASSDLLIIHYSDQYSSSSGYDAITVTRKSQQYFNVILEYLKAKRVKAQFDDVTRIINLFNAINGEWLLHLVSAKQYAGINKESTFSREKISIVAAIKVMLAVLKHPEIIWVPISMEEFLRVSKGAGLSQKEGLLSAKNLGFGQGAKCDDLLFVGLYQLGGNLKVFLYPTEVKTGENSNSVMKKALEQVTSTADGLENALNPPGASAETISYRVNRNFMMQLVITSCKKMKLYHVDDSQNWDVVLEQYREALLNENYKITNDLRGILGKGAILSFKKGIVAKISSYKKDLINVIEMPEQDEFGLILREVQPIYEDLNQRDDKKIILMDKQDLENLSENLKVQNTDVDATYEEPTNNVEEVKVTINMNDQEIIEEVKKNDKVTNVDDQGIHVLFGTNQQNGEKIYWEPNNTDKCFHMNTGIIGTMGTGKTQFTQSLIVQLYQNRFKNIDSEDLGILIFDYKGDYNEKKTDFIKLTDATIIKPYKLPFNPLALTWSGEPKNLLPVHTANTFVDTLSKVYPNLGPKQKNVLMKCVEEAYTKCGIIKVCPDTWTNDPPTFSQVCQIYYEDKNIKKGDVLEAALQKISMFELFESNSVKTEALFKLLHGVVVIDLSGHDSDIQNLIVAITLDLFYSQMQASGHSVLVDNMRQLNKIILVDEADNFLRGSYPSLRKILKEGREFGVGTILSTQFLEHFITKDEDYSKYILTWVVHNVADLVQKDIRFVFNTTSGSQDELRLCQDIKNLERHESIIKIGNADRPTYMKDKPFWEYLKDMES